MAASWTQAARGPFSTLALMLLAASLLNAGVAAQNDDDGQQSVFPAAPGQTVPVTTKAPKPTDPQTVVTPTIDSLTTKTTGESAAASPTATEKAEQQVTETVPVQTDRREEAKAAPLPLPGRGDGPNNKPPMVPQDDVVCVSKEAVKDKNGVSLKLEASSACKDTKVKIESVRQELCGEDCKLYIYQEDDSDQILVTGKYVEEDVAGMAGKFNNDNIKDKIGVQEAAPRWGRNSKLVLVSLLLTGLLLAALLVAGYYLKTHRRTSKGVRLAESFQVDEENQANTLVSVAPLPQEPQEPQEPQDKPTANGEPAAENGTSPAPNGHSATQTPVADTEM
ncbi:hematopoietic progenitor cell antigen CD34 [Pungitius pungitius]|uniref:hematopoietic progenitor cell antigen CD34 n=1 Tax=Pungitius pungitius TaxID=134920 RepID=UPI002E129BD9